MNALNFNVNKDNINLLANFTNISYFSTLYKFGLILSPSLGITYSLIVCLQVTVYKIHDNKICNNT